MAPKDKDGISVKDRAAVQAHIKTLTEHKDKLTTASATAKARVGAITSALGVTADGSPAADVPTGTSDTVSGKTDTAVSQLNTASTKLQTWLDGLHTIDGDGKTTVQTG